MFPSRPFILSTDEGAQPVAEVPLAAELWPRPRKGRILRHCDSIATVFLPQVVHNAGCVGRLCERQTCGITIFRAKKRKRDRQVLGGSDFLGVGRLLVK
jgi:hypothetical protein